MDNIWLKVNSNSPKISEFSICRQIINCPLYYKADWKWIIICPFIQILTNRQFISWLNNLSQNLILFISSHSWVEYSASEFISSCRDGPPIHQYLLIILPSWFVSALRIKQFPNLTCNEILFCENVNLWKHYLR